MGEEWIVRVEGHEYGPVDLGTLREWSREGRLIPANEIRRAGDEHWIRAGELPEIFGEPKPETSSKPPRLPPRDFAREKSLREVLAGTLRIYRAGFARFVLLGLLTSVPMFILQWSLPKIPLPDFTTGSYAISPPALPAISFVMFVVLLLTWPFSTAGFQFVADDIYRGVPRSFRAELQAAWRCWGRVFVAALLVYSSFCFWLFVPFWALLGLAGIGSPFAAVLILPIGGFMVYMNARLFINFLFWQQTVTLDALPALEALRESKDLARSVPGAPKLERPLYRGAIIASIWLLLLLVLTFGAQLPFMLVRFAGVESPEQVTAIMKKLSEAQTPDALMIAADVATALINLLLRPLLAGAFVVLYYDARARSGRTSDAETSLE